MEIYITTNNEGFLTGYSTSECTPGKKIDIDENDAFSNEVLLVISILRINLYLTKIKKKSFSMKRRCKMQYQAQQINY